MLIDLALFMQLAASCAPTVAPETLASVARTESGFDPLTISDNDTRRSFKPATLDEAQGLAEPLIAAGHSVDVGLMQVNSRNFARLGLTVASALDPCTSLTAGARILADDYPGGSTPETQQHAIRVALSRYNTGNAARGFVNGYVRKVEAAVGYIVPALRASPKQAAPAAPATASAVPAPTPVPRSWDVWAQDDAATGAQPPSWDASPGLHGPALVHAAPAPKPDPADPTTGRVVMLQPSNTLGDTR